MAQFGKLTGGGRGGSMLILAKELQLRILSRS